MRHLRRVADYQVLFESLASPEIVDPVRFGGLTVIPMVHPDRPEPDWVLADEAIADGTLTVTERSHVGSVPWLVVSNNGHRTVLLLDGSELVGAKQNRILNTSVVVGAAQSVELPVSCVERGRWAYSSGRLSGTGHVLYASVRGKKTRQVHEALHARRGHVSDQAAIWGDLDEKAAAFDVRSVTAAMSAVYAARTADVESYRGALPVQAGQVGAIVYGVGGWWGLELLTGPGLFARAWPRLLSGYVMEALSTRGRQPRASASRQLARILAAPVEVFPGVGLGDEYRFLGSRVVGAAVVVDGALGHLMAFPS